MGWVPPIQTALDQALKTWIERKSGMPADLGFSR